MRLFLAAAVLVASLAPAFAADPLEEAPTQSVENREIVFDAGVGLQLEPKFPSSRKYLFQPYPLFDLRFLRLPVFGDVVTGKVKSLSIYPAINFTGSREESDASYLAGTGKVDFAAELGPGIAFRHGPFRAFAEVRYGITGHNGFVGEVGADYIVTPFERFQFAFGPRVSAATDDYMDTYFSVPASATVLAPYDASGGFKDVGLTATATYRLTERLDLHARAAYTRFVGDAADSPIVKAGNQDEFRVGIGVTYEFGLDLY
ncbi:MipA/OmpV family protein [Acuticoccus mangrovi]|uniref:MipA/OmpV family protein n=1 Tax=Acuticoccus mangrovi TaxID=2796142 RepID=A0A934IQN7_9HYPH|nr:MipA/OmpV family protein [Acuticoccus mangrovi]